MKSVMMLLPANAASFIPANASTFGEGKQLTQVLIRKSLLLIVGQPTFATYRSTCLEVEKIFI